MSRSPLTLLLVLGLLGGCAGKLAVETDASPVRAKVGDDVVLKCQFSRGAAPRGPEPAGGAMVPPGRAAGGVRHRGEREPAGRQPERGGAAERQRRALPEPGDPGERRQLPLLRHLRARRAHQTGRPPGRGPLEAARRGAGGRGPSRLRPRPRPPGAEEAGPGAEHPAADQPQAGCGGCRGWGGGL
ncbi:unnamed protein product, partial [Natator depressus]